MTRSFADLPLLNEAPMEMMTFREFRFVYEKMGWCIEGPQSFEELHPYLASADEIYEFAASAKAVGLGSVLVGRGTASPWGHAGFYYSPEEYLDLGHHRLIMINPELKPDHLSLLDLFLHEAAHVFAGEQHTWTFLVLLNVMRIRDGLAPSNDPYDCLEDRLFPDVVNSNETRLHAQASAAYVGYVLAACPLDVRGCKPYADRHQDRKPH